MANPLTRKLELFGPLPEQDRRLLDEVVARTRKLGSHEDIIQEGEAPNNVHLVLKGFACRYKLLPNGARQIFAYLIPGDFCDLNIFILKTMDHSIAALSPCTVVDIPRDRVLDMARRPDIGRALWWATLVDEAILREWIVNLGQRDAEHRTAHLFSELHLRLASVGLVDDGAFDLPITQIELGDTLGLSAVHMNRCLQSLRASGLIIFKHGRLVIPDVGLLHAMCDFSPNYLHLTGGKHDQGQATQSQSV